MSKEEGGDHVMMEEDKDPQIKLWPQNPNHLGRKVFSKFAGMSKPKPLPAAVRRRRNNYRLKKLVAPKSPLMIVNELVGQVNYSFVDNPGVLQALLQPGLAVAFTAQCQVNGETFHGTGPSKQSAKCMCAEHVVRSIAVKKFVESKRTQKKDGRGLPLKPNQMEDETPWAQLASLAFFKLFNEWQAQGWEIPSDLWKSPPDQVAAAAEPVEGESGQSKENCLQPCKKLPENPTGRHPVQLLNELRGGVTFSLVGETGTAPNVIFTFKTTVEGNEFSGEGRSKKDAKRNCAVNALKAVYDIVYPEAMRVE